MLYYTNNNESYWDTTMLSSLLRIHRSKLKRELLKVTLLPDEDYIIYNNRFLFTDDAVVKLISSMAKIEVENKN